MRMPTSFTRRFAALLAAAGAAGCSEAPGEIIVVVQTDMELPKDIDSLRIEITASGVPWMKEVFRGLGQPGALLLPATVGIVASEEKPNEPITVRVSAGSDKQWKAMREVVTVIPPNRISTLHVPINFLCDGSASGLVADEDAAVENQCPTGETCVAGTCSPVDVNENDLPEYSEADVFGGGTTAGEGECFDVAKCFEGATRAELDAETCTIALPAGDQEINLAILTEGAGMCAGTDCFVALDADSALGWRRAGDAIQLPDGICRRELPGQASAGVALSTVRDGCPRKTNAIPTCGPWSRVGAKNTQNGAGPTALVTGQEHPVSLEVVNDGDVRIVWANVGLFDALEADAAPVRKTNGAVRVFSLTTRKIAELASSAASPRQVAARGLRVFWTATDDLGEGSLQSQRLGGDATPVLEGLTTPEGLAALQAPNDGPTTLFWTEFRTGRVMTVVDGDPTSATTVADDNDDKPARVVAVGNEVCWTVEGKSDAPTGSVRCRHPGGVSTAGSDLAIPRAIAMQPGSVYWANYQTGEIFRNRTDGGTPQLVADGQSRPNGIALDERHVYWTNQGDGTVWRRAQDMSEPAQRVIDRQNRPGEIKISGGYIYWINEGSPHEASGSIMRLAIES